MANEIYDDEEIVHVVFCDEDTDEEIFPIPAIHNEVSNSVEPHINAVQPSLDNVVNEGKQQIGLLRMQNITRADFDNGQKFEHSHETSISTLSNKNVSLSVGEHGVNIFIPNPNSSPREILEDFDNMSRETQRMRGAVVGRSQAWVSNQDNDDE